MSHRIFNFSAGPAMLPTEVLEKSAQALVDYQGKGFGIAEVSHRGKEFDAVADEAIARCKQLLGLGDTHDVLFLQGGATALFTLIPMNFLHTSADYLVGGEWSKKAATNGKELGKINVVATSKSSINTPPTFGVYILLEIFRWLEAQGGLAAMEKRNATKAKLLYDAIDNSNGFYKGTVSIKEQRSHMNVTYTLPSEELTDEFVKTAAKNEMIGLKGYRTVGGIRASIYNAMPVEGCQALAAFMKDFASKKS